MLGAATLRRMSDSSPQDEPQAVAGLPQDALRKLLGLQDTHSNEAPSWALVPPPASLAMPPGRRIWYLRFPSMFTDRPDKGHELAGMPGLWRQCLVWGLSPGDESIAIDRAMGDSNRLDIELVKQSIRAIDGHVVDQTGNQSAGGSIDRFWVDLGQRCRNEVKLHYARMSTLTKEQRLLFFVSCVEQRIG